MSDPTAESPPHNPSGNSDPEATLDLAAASVDVSAPDRMEHLGRGLPASEGMEARRKLFAGAMNRQ